MTRPRSILKSGWAIVNGRGRIRGYYVWPTKAKALAMISFRIAHGGDPTEKPVRVDVVVRTQTKRKKR